MLLFFNCNLICTSVNIYRSSQEYILQLASKLHSESHSILLQSIQPHYLLISNDTENLITNDNRSFLGKLLSYLTEMAIKFCIMLMALWPLLLKLFLHPHSSAMHDFKSWLSSFFLHLSTVAKCLSIQYRRSNCTQHCWTNHFSWSLANFGLDVFYLILVISLPLRRKATSPSK